MLAGWCCCGGYLTGGGRTFYDAQGKAVPRSQWMTAANTPATLYDEQGDVVPADQVQSAYNATSGTTTTSYRSGSSHWGWSPFYSSRSWSSYPSYGGGTVTKPTTNTGKKK